MGQVFEQVGDALIQYGVVMSALAPLLSNPFTAGPAALAAGIALATLGKLMEAAFQGGSGSAAIATGVGNAQTINIALPGGVGQGGAPIPGAQPPAVPFGARPVPILPPSLATSSAIQAPAPNLPAPTAALGTPRAIAVTGNTFIGNWSPQTEAQIMQAIRRAERRGL